MTSLLFFLVPIRAEEVRRQCQEKCTQEKEEQQFMPEGQAGSKAPTLTPDSDMWGLVLVSYCYCPFLSERGKLI